MTDERVRRSIISEASEKTGRDRVLLEVELLGIARELGQSGSLVECRLLIERMASELGSQDPHLKLALADLACDLLDDPELATELLGDPHLESQQPNIGDYRSWGQAAVKRLYVALRFDASEPEVDRLLNDLAQFSILGGVFDARSPETLEMLAERGLLDPRSRALAEMVLSKALLSRLHQGTPDEQEIARIHGIWKACSFDAYASRPSTGAGESR